MSTSSRNESPATAPFAHFPPLVSEQIAKAVRDPTLDLNPWAAYELGYHAVTMPLNVRLVLTGLGIDPGCFDAIPNSASALRQSCDLLSGVMSAGSATLIRDAANDIEKFNNDARRSFHRSGGLTWDVATGNYLAARFPVLLRNALAHDCQLRPWLGIGQAIGAFIRDDHAGQHPVSFRPVVDAVRCLAKTERDAQRELKELTALIDRPEAADEAGLRRVFVARLATDWRLDDDDSRPNNPFFAREVWKFHRKLEDGLLARKAHSPPHEMDHVPRWDRVAGKLMFNGSTVRVVAGQARGVRKVLDQLQTAGWPAYIDTSYSDDAKKKLIKSMNEKLSLIEFYSAGSKNGIGWRLKTAP